MEKDGAHETCLEAFVHCIRLLIQGSREQPTECTCKRDD